MKRLYMEKPFEKSENKPCCDILKMAARIRRATVSTIAGSVGFSSFNAVRFPLRAFEDDAVSCLLKLSSSLRIRTVRPSSYHEAKQAAVEYHGAKQTLFKAFQKAGLGAWVKKPIEQDQFSVTT